MPLPADAPAASSAERLLQELSEQDLANPAIAAAIAYLVEHYIDQPSLNELAAATGMHPHHFQRVFKRWAGISPKRFAQYLTVEHAKRLLSSSQSILDVALEVGLSGPSRLHDLFVACEAMTPGEYKLRGCDMEIRHGVHDTPFGPALIGVTERGVCWLGFAPDGDVVSARAIFEEEWGAATLVEDRRATASVAARTFGGLDTAQGMPPSPLLLRGTNFQIKVWKALLAIPAGRVVSYQQLASAIGHPTAARAVGQALGANPLSVLIPCHRVIRKTGIVDGYRWGTPRKRALLAWESGQTEMGDD